MNTQLVESLVQVILALPEAERALLEERLLGSIPYPSTRELANFSEKGKAFDFLHNEPDLYILEDGEPI